MRGGARPVFRRCGIGAQHWQVPVVTSAISSQVQTVHRVVGMAGTVELLSGWGVRTRSRAHVVRPESTDQCADLVAGAPTVLGRGLGRSYGRRCTVRRGSGHLHRAVAGVQPPGAVMTWPRGPLDDLLRRIVPAGFFVPVTPGTRYVSMAGALASDIHGKNHHADGAMSDHTESIDLILASGEQVRVSPHSDPDLFWATAGGMGLTGLITVARVRMRLIETSRLRVDTTRAEDLDDLFAAMHAADAHSRYSVACGTRWPTAAGSGAVC